ncbi:type II secretion system protein J [Candidatus Omnitrophota bacterium]
MILKRREGLTLVEITIVVFLFSIILAAIFSALAMARTIWKTGGSQLSIQQEARRGLRIMSMELRQARLSTIAGVPVNGTNYNSITFQIPVSISETGTTWSSNIQYSVGGLNNTQLLRLQDATQTVLANDISVLNLSRNVSTPEVINISITSQKNTFPGYTATQSTITLNSEARVRND